MLLEMKKAELAAAPEWIRACVARSILGYASESQASNLAKRGQAKFKYEGRALFLHIDDVKFFFEMRVRQGKIK